MALHNLSEGFLSNLKALGMEYHPLSCLIIPLTEAAAWL